MRGRYGQRTPCKVADCGQPVASHGLCAVHWRRFERHGSTDRIERRRNTYTSPLGYVYVYVEGKRRAQPEHRVVMEEMLGRPLMSGETVHHRNGVRSDNRPANLELWVSWQPNGCRVSDLVAFARDVLARYDREE